LSAPTDFIEALGIAAFDFGGVSILPPLFDLRAAFGVGFVVRAYLLGSQAVILD